MKPVPMTAAPMEERSGNGIPPVNGKAGAGHESGCSRGKEQDRPGDILGLAPAAHWRPQVDRRDMGGVIEAYSEVAKRLGIMPESVQGENKGPVLVQ